MCHCCRIHGGAHVAIVVIVTTVREALPTTMPPFSPAEGATGLALNLQAWLREPQLQSPRHCNLGQRQRQSTDPQMPIMRARQRVCTVCLAAMRGP